jgi:Flp pilus assembly protein TadB
MTDGAAACGSCGQAMDPSRAVYDKDGVLQCQACAAKTSIADGDSRAAASVASSSVGVLIGGVLSVTCFNPLLIVSAVTVISGVSWLVMVKRNPALRQNMGGKFVPALLACVVGLLLAAVPLLLIGLAGLGLAVQSTRP